MSRPAETVGDKIQLVTFRVADQVFALNVLDVERVVRYQPVTVLPQSPDYFDGMMPYGHDMIPVLDLRKRFAVSASLTDALRVVVVAGGFGRVGLLVDAALSLQAVPAGTIVMPPPVVRGLTADYIAGIIADPRTPIIVLAISKLIASTERISLSSVEVGALDE